MIGNTVSRLAVAAIVALSLAGCGASRDAVSGDGWLLEYRLPGGKRLRYIATSSTTQKMEMMGKSMEIAITSELRFTMVSKGLKDGLNEVAVSLDSVAFAVRSPRGELKPDMKNVNGKAFTMNLSSTGKERDLKGTETIEYELAPGQKQNPTNIFAMTFPDLAPRSVKTGESWLSKDTISQSTGGGKALMVLDSKSTLLGVEEFHGYRCAKLVSKFEGPIRGEESQGPMSFVTTGTTKGVDTVYFAYKEGFVVAVTTRASIDAVAEGKGAQEISIPIKREMRNDLRLVDLHPSR